jgi:hypothetical protein
VLGVAAHAAAATLCGVSAGHALSGGPARRAAAVQLKADKRLLALDAELEHLFSTWFDVAFLELRASRGIRRRR